VWDGRNNEKCLLNASYFISVGSEQRHVFLSNTLNNSVERCKMYTDQINISAVFVLKKFHIKNCNSRLHIEEFHDLYTSSNIILVIK